VSALILLAIAVAGSCFARSYPLARYRQVRSIGWDAYFHVASWGTLLLVVAIFVTALVDWFNFPSRFFGVFGYGVHDLIAASHISALGLKTGFACLLSMVLGVLLGWRLDNPANQEAMYQLLLKEHDLERMLYTSSSEGTLVQINLKSRKVYIGLVFDGSISPGIEPHEQFLIFPVLSGYRDKDTLNMVLTNSYETFYEKLSGDETLGGWKKFADKFHTLIWVSEISSMAYFDPTAYSGIQSNMAMAESVREDLLAVDAKD
jgi:hypothetical protein